MNIPNSRRANNRSEPLNFNFESMYPLIDPINAEISVAGITSIREFCRFGASLPNAFTKASRDGLPGRCHILAIPTSCMGFRLVARSTYMGSRKKAAKTHSSTIERVFFTIL